MNKIVFIEDDERLAELIKTYLEKNYFQVVTCHDGSLAANIIQEYRPEIVLLDLMLPNMSGLEICKEIRQKFKGPIIFITASDDNINQVLALDSGADDYIIKPVEPRVLLARVQAVARRFKVPARNDNVIKIGNLSMNEDTREVLLYGQNIDLTSGEFELLLVLAKHAGHTLSRDDISLKLKGVEYEGFDRSFDINISRLRKKLGDDSGKPNFIKTVWGKGYILIKDAWS